MLFRGIDIEPLMAVSFFRVFRHHLMECSHCSPHIGALRGIPFRLVAELPARSYVETTLHVHGDEGWYHAQDE
jgi:hypothetical protein